jgi:NTE family protein
MKIALVLSGGISLGAYQGGAFEALQDAGLVPSWIAGSSVGAINAAIIAGNPPDRRLARLQHFWDIVRQPGFAAPAGFEALTAKAGPAREWHHMANAVWTRLFGQPKAFLPDPFADPTGVYNVSPLRRLLTTHVEFDLLNDGPIRLSVLTVDIETGEPIVFDTTRDRIGPDHLLASCGFIGDFPAVEIGGRLLGDGGLVANAPVDLVLEEAGKEPSACFLVDLFSRRGRRPGSPITAGERRSDLLFASQTWQAIRHHQRLLDLRASLAEIAGRMRKDRDAECVRELGGAMPTLLLVMSYRPDPEEILMRGFDFSPATLSRRWCRGVRDMQQAIKKFAELRAGSAQAGLSTVEID